MTRPLADFRSNGRPRRFAAAALRPKGVMRAALSLAVMLAGLAAGCSWPASRIATPAPIALPSTSDVPRDAVTAGRETRYYVDEKGEVWDDRGRKVDTAPKPL